MTSFGGIVTAVIQLVAAVFALLISTIAVFGDAVRSLLCGSRRQAAPKSILITGATSGIGEALAIHYAAPGVTLALTGRKADALAAVTQQCEKKGATVYAKQLDVIDREPLAKWIKEVDDKAPLDLVIANAGVTETTAGTQGDVEASARSVFDTNVGGVWNTIFPALPAMRARRSGKIAIMSSLAGFGAVTGSAAYSASKAAVKVYGEALRYELLRDGVQVNVICPGYVKSPLTDANRFPQPGKVSMSFAVKAIVSGLARDDPVIAFPTSMYTIVWLLSSLTPVVRDWIARHRFVGALAYMRSKKGGASSKASSASAAEPAAAPVSASRSKGKRSE
jgi:NADP-dependent 3-hydroxy acid dehydrogenase YdfG